MSSEMEAPKKKKSKLDRFGKPNPFEQNAPKQKFTVLNRQVKGAKPINVGKAMSKALSQRKSTLLNEYKNENKTNSFIDLRLTERRKFRGMSDEDREIERLKLERKRQLRGRKGSKSAFNLGDDEGGDNDVLTHDGEALGVSSAAESRVDGLGDDDDQEDEFDGVRAGGQMSYRERQEEEIEKARQAHGFMKGVGENVNEHVRRIEMTDQRLNAMTAEKSAEERKKMSQKEIMDDVIKKSKLFKAAKQAKHAEMESFLEELDSNFGDLQQYLEFKTEDDSRDEKILSRVAAMHGSVIGMDGKPIYIPTAGKDLGSTTAGTGDASTGGVEAAAMAAGIPVVEDDFQADVIKFAQEERVHAGEKLVNAVEEAKRARDRLVKLEEARLRRMRGEDDDDDDGDDSDGVGRALAEKGIVDVDGDDDDDDGRGGMGQLKGKAGWLAKMTKRRKELKAKRRAAKIVEEKEKSLMADRDEDEDEDEDDEEDEGEDEEGESVKVGKKRTSSQAGLKDDDDGSAKKKKKKKVADLSSDDDDDDVVMTKKQTPKGVSNEGGDDLGENYFIDPSLIVDSDDDEDDDDEDDDEEEEEEEEDEEDEDDDEDEEDDDDEDDDMTDKPKKKSGKQEKLSAEEIKQQAATALPYLFDAPRTFGQFESLLLTRGDATRPALKDHEEIVTRLQTQYHVRLNEGENTVRMEVLYRCLMRYVRVLCEREAVRVTEAEIDREKKSKKESKKKGGHSLDVMSSTIGTESSPLLSSDLIFARFDWVTRQLFDLDDMIPRFGARTWREMLEAIIQNARERVVEGAINGEIDTSVYTGQSSTNTSSGNSNNTGVGSVGKKGKDQSKDDRMVDDVEEGHTALQKRALEEQKAKEHEEMMKARNHLPILGDVEVTRMKSNIEKKIMEDAGVSQSSSSSSSSSALTTSQPKPLVVRKSHYLLPHEIVFLVMLGRLFPVSDYKHNIATTAQLFMAESLVSFPIIGARDLVSSILIAGSLLEASSVAVRIVPEVLAFVHSALTTTLDISETTLNNAIKQYTKQQSKQASSSSSSFPEFSERYTSSERTYLLEPRSRNFSESLRGYLRGSLDASSPLPHVAYATAFIGNGSDKEWKQVLTSQSDKLPLSLIFLPHNSFNVFTSPIVKALILTSLLKLVHLTSRIISTTPAYSEIFAPITCVLDTYERILLTNPKISNATSTLATDSTTSSDKKLVSPSEASAAVASTNSAFIAMNGTSSSLLNRVTALRKCLEASDVASRVERRPIIKRAKPVEIKEFEPSFDEHYRPGKDLDTDKERVEIRKLTKKLKREKKGAMREVRRDTMFLASERRRNEEKKERAKEAHKKAMWATLEREKAQTNPHTMVSKKNRGKKE